MIENQKILQKDISSKKSGRSSRLYEIEELILGVELQDKCMIFDSVDDLSQPPTDSSMMSQSNNTNDIFIYTHVSHLMDED